MREPRKAGKRRHHGLARNGLKNKMGLGRFELSTGHSYGVKKPHLVSQMLDAEKPQSF